MAPIIQPFLINFSKTSVINYKMNKNLYHTGQLTITFWLENLYGVVQLYMPPFEHNYVQSEQRHFASVAVFNLVDWMLAHHFLFWVLV
jgi:hypothetical protein